VKEVEKRRERRVMEKSIKIHTEAYDKLKKLASDTKRPLVTTLDIIIDYYMEENNEKRENIQT